MQKIIAPTTCPSCDTELESVNNILFCRNPSCGSQEQKKIEHFAKTMKIKGLGSKSIEKLGLSCIEEIYYLDLESVSYALASKKLAEKLLLEIENSKAASANTLLPALGVPLIGKTATAKLSKVCDTMFDITEDTCKKAGLGPKATESLMNWYNNTFQYIHDNLPFNFQFEKPKEVANKGIVCISGKLSSFKTKAEATQELEKAGYEVKSSLTKQVTILVNESGIESSKTRKAEQIGITIITNIKQLLEK